MIAPGGDQQVTGGLETVRPGIMPEAIPLWPEGAPGAHDGSQPDNPRADESPTLTPYLLDEAERPAVIVCPGGGYGNRAAHEGAPIAERMNAGGFHAFVLAYRVSPFRHPVPHGDALRAIRMVRARAGDWRVRPDAIAILGFSAGGHLAASAATINDGGDPAAADPIDRVSSRPDAAILCYPVISFGAWRHDGSRRNLLGPEVRQPELEQLLSPDRQVTRATPPTFLWHTAEDAGVPVENSLRFASACAKHGVPVELHVYPHGRHGIGLAEGMHAASWSQLCVDWLAMTFS